jgi:YD repeat-containing protein
MYEIFANSTSQLTSVKNPLGQVESFTYNAVGNVESDTKPDGSKVTNSYDNLNRVSNVNYQGGEATDISEGDLSALKNIGSHDVSYSYDIMGNRTSMEDENGTTKYTSDKMGRITSVNSPKGENVQYEYDSIGRKGKLIYPDGSYVTYSYDDLNRIRKVADSDGFSFIS